MSITVIEVLARAYDDRMLGLVVAERTKPDGGFRHPNKKKRGRRIVWPADLANRHHDAVLPAS